MYNYPLVSVVMITYGHELFIENAINSILMQKYDGCIELIIANDCSPDGTDKIIISILEKVINSEKFNIKYTPHKNNKGIMPNFVWALKECQGKYIAICEGDDYWIDDLKIKKQVDFLEKNNEYSIHSGHAQLLENESLTSIIGDPHHKKTYLINDFFSKNNLITCTTMLRLSNIIPKNWEKIYFGDWMLYVNTLIAYPGSKAYVSDELYSVYRINEMGAMSQIAGIKSDEKHFIQIFKIHQLFKVKYSSEDISAINNYSLKLYRYYLSINNLKSAVGMILKNFKLVYFKIPFRKYLSYFRYRKHLKPS
ncbi:hypothetical protein A0O34_07700 [Chryseobacterium glaciei]|uniref:Glycosyltransferase 2-like domain-containing protein n=1 Tax=Chryseobacterium glaciei TaxID=1685010 RepID=A0A172XTR1_9FLAO|nr:glycosyltransferase [Chryseobacterium glaciei]ANF50407.1 hypothetical protein A0O34_07700 [Chryseobacterium glaciei]